VIEQRVPFNQQSRVTSHERRSTELLLADDHGTAYRIDQATGAIRADVSVGDAFSGPPIAVGDSLVVFTGNRAITCLDLASARVCWTRNLPLSSSRPYAWRGSVLAATVNGELVALRARDGMPLWSRMFMGVIRGIGQDDRTLYLGTQEGVIYAYTRGRPLGPRSR